MRTWSPQLLIIALLALIAVLYLGAAHIFAPFLVSYLAIGIGLIKMPWSQFMQRADLSYGIYLTHALVLTTLMKLHSFENPLSLFAACMPVTIFVAWLTWTFVEKPALNHKSMPAELTRALLQRVPLGSRLLVLLEPRPVASLS